MNLKFDNKININYKNNSKQKIILFQINIKTIKKSCQSQLHSNLFERETDNRLYKET